MAHAQAVIRDAEIESVVKDLAKPIFKVAGLNPNNVSVFIYQSEEPNAFVPEGKTMFISTGLLSYSDKPETLAGVIAHEVGHITSGHVHARKGELENLRKKALLSSVIGALAGLATKSPEVFLGTSAAGSEASLRQFLHFTRGQESSADQAALKYLEKLGISNHGLIEFLDELKTEERINSDNSTNYLRSHPVNQERINAIKEFNRNHSNSGGFDNNSYEKFRRIIAKVRAYTLSPRMVINLYNHDTSTAGIYAMAIANMRIPNQTQALALTDKLIHKEPNNPYFREIKAQTFLEMKRVNESVEEFKKAYSLLPKNPLMKFQLAAVLNLTKRETQKSIALLEEAVSAEPDFPSNWHQLGVAYGIVGDSTNSNLALAQSAVLREDAKMAKRMLLIAEKDVLESKNQRTILRYKDIKQAVLELEEKPAND